MIERVLAVPSKRYGRSPIAYLTQPECEALLAAPDLSTWLGRRDRTLLLVALQTGLRVSELIGLRWQDVSVDTGAPCARSGERA
ncbi:MAG: tyrosine-type recombinase/integrase [Chromatiaceae bacterium]